MQEINKNEEEEEVKEEGIHRGNDRDRIQRFIVRDNEALARPKTLPHREKKNKMKWKIQNGTMPHGIWTNKQWDD